MLPSSRPLAWMRIQTALAPGSRARADTPIEVAPPSCHGTSLGWVIFMTHRGERAEAILDCEGRWSCPMLPVLDRVLNILFEPGRLASGEAPTGHEELDRVAAWLNGRVQLGWSGDEATPGPAPSVTEIRSIR